LFSRLFDLTPLALFPQEFIQKIFYIVPSTDDHHRDLITSGQLLNSIAVNFSIWYQVRLAIAPVFKRV